MTHRERVLAALNHEEPDRVPRDLGQGVATGINVKAYSRLVEHLGLEEQDADSGIDPHSLIAFPSEAVLRRFDIDCRMLDIPRRAEGLDEDSYRDEWGTLWVRPEGGQFIFKEGPFQEKEPTLAELEAHPWPDPRHPSRIEGLREKALQLRQETDYAIFLRLPYATVWDCQRIRGFGEFLEDLAVNPVLAEALMEHALVVEAGIAEFVLEEVGDCIDVVSFPDDLGVQDRLMIGLEMYRRMVKPFHQRIVDAIKSKTDAKIVMHNDGAIFPMIPDIIDMGVDCLNPVQVSARGMETDRMKAEFGADLSFWGAIDTNFALPRGTPEDVRDEVRTRIGDLAPGGGYVVGSVHNIQAEVPPENVVAMFDSAEEYGQYPNLTDV
jgi:uroporphyrinogen decarboxylase